MKKTLFAAAAVAAFAFSGCSGNDSAQNESAEAHTEEMEHETLPISVVVETPTFESVAEPFQTQVEELVGEYMKMKDALVNSNTEATQAAAKEVLRVAQAMPLGTLTTDEKAFAEEHTAEVITSADKIANATDLDEQRGNLELLSEAVFSLAKAFGAADGELYYQHCPMALNGDGGYWLSSDKAIRNPYFGEQMMSCGSTEEVYKK
ncbi:DUF3347 domain-containing protein [Pontibacter oryzae]|uniref:DUF3347 domain-containing protein n=1 Tax=Pontibacter oryzae TaxID=2304593 RepID=A0A399RX21_9BACT|nr:DUF3347 domain-containing protein [Pontibacter oryzae]RIJ34332.1 DUF3347 domain-containing protein [Pontibacter oryzae]